MKAKRIILVLGDQLDINSAALKDVNHETDEVLMIESKGEAEYVWSHQARIAIFLSAMRHFAASLIANNFPLTYIKESDLSLIKALELQIVEKQATHLVCVTPGEWRLKIQIEALAALLNVQLVMHEDDHFYCSIPEFKLWAADKKELRMEYFYRYMRKKHQVLMDADGNPASGKWNFDDENRRAYGKQGPGLIPAPEAFPPDHITRDVISYVETQYAHHPGTLQHFAWPVTRGEALQALSYFIAHRLQSFGVYQDAMWKETPFGWHSMLSSCLNLKLLNPREVVQAALSAYQTQSLALATVEGFIRQVIGWREFVRGIYYLDMPKLATENFYGHTNPLPAWYWTAQTKMNCMRDAIGQTLKYGYAHHIQRLMVTGNFALLAEITPQEVSDWYLAVYVDAIEWVEMPNVLGMALFANGGRFTSKPYIASGAYVKRMSNYCDGCAYKPDVQHGEQACPMTTLYWNFLIKHKSTLEKNPRTRLMTANLARMDEEKQSRIVSHAQVLLSNLDAI